MDRAVQVVSDWGGTHSTQLAAAAGLDMEQNTAQFFSEDKLRDANVSIATIDGMVRRILRSMFGAGLFERASQRGGEGSMDRDARSDAHRKLAHDLAVAGTILLRNEGSILPLSPSGRESVRDTNDAPARRSTMVAVIGDEFTGIGGESGQAGWAGRGPDFLVTPSEAIARRLAGPQWKARSPSVCATVRNVTYTPANTT
jgi:beta-glucosidase